MFTRFSLLLSAGIAALALVGNAAASGGSYTFTGGTAKEQATVRKALDASAFPWSVVPQTIQIQIGKNAPSQAWPGHITLDANLLDAGQFAWGLVQHEYGHQVDYFLLDDAKRNFLFPLLGGTCWFRTCDASHSQLTSERFASTLAWSYWPSSANILKPEGPGDESAALKPAAFRALLTQVLGVPDGIAAAKAAAPGDNTWATATPKPAKKKAKKKG
jgi:hypothetical protein